MATLSVLPETKVKAAPIVLPIIPTAVKDFITYFNTQSKTPVPDILEPFIAYESELRKVYAQQPDHEAVRDGLANTVPVFAGHESELKIRARNLSEESTEAKEKYIMPLSDDQRKPDGSPAVVASLDDFKKNFNLFSETSLTDLDWNNVVAAGSSVTTALLPVPKKWSESKKSLREYYHEHLAPASDVDLFLYGLTEKEAIEKIKHIEKAVKDSVLQEVTTIRTKNTITIASQYPTRHVQIVLRLYDSISQIITGFDVDCACVAYNGKQVYASPRALASFVTQINTVDLTRRSPSYENRLSKYSHRGFEVHWPLLDRTRIDPTIFERSFNRTQGLARLLVLEKLPKTTDRDSYMDQRRSERGRPPINQHGRNVHKHWGNIKDEQEDDVAEWVEADEISNYHTMVIPYGKRFTAAKINRILYTKDLLLNAEWNIPRDRTVHLHRHPCFFGSAEDVLNDCCGYCPSPVTDEDIQVANEESKIYISGELTFIKDDPGRQEIGSFNPITTDDWTEMAFVGNTQMLCQAIVDGDIEYVRSWCMQDGNDVNTRDYVGRTPLHLGVVTSTIEIVQCLIDNGARLVARLADGRTALHLAAQQGRTDVVKALMTRSLTNEEIESENLAKRKLCKKDPDQDTQNLIATGESMVSAEEEVDSSDFEMDDSEDSQADSVTMGSFIKVNQRNQPQDSNDVPEDTDGEPDVYDIDVLSWDFKTSPLHLAILNGHVDMIRLLVEEYGADILAPIKLFHTNNTPKGALLTLFLALSVPAASVEHVVRVLLELGASTAQADMNYLTALHYVVQKNREDILDILFHLDRAAAQKSLNYVAIGGNGRRSPKTALTIAIENGHESMVSKLIHLGAKSSISFEDFIKPFILKNEYAKNWSQEQSIDAFHDNCDQPIFLAAMNEMCGTITELLDNGADPKTLDKNSYRVIKNQNYYWQTRASILDIIRQKLASLRKFRDESKGDTLKMPETLQSEGYYLSGLNPGTYKYWTAKIRLQSVTATNNKAWAEYKKEVNKRKVDQVGAGKKLHACEALIEKLVLVEEKLIATGAQTFHDMYPHIPEKEKNNYAPFNVPETMRYETQLTFQIADLNDQLKEGYFDLFEAVWTNDVEKVKALTLSSWKGSDGAEHAPLKIAVTDGVTASMKTSTSTPFVGFFPFSLAVLRKHLQLAETIVKIAQAQYQPEEDNKKRAWMADHSEDMSDSEYSGMEDNDDSLRIHTEAVDETFTVNVADVSDIVKSHVKPLTMIEWSCNAGWFLNDQKGPESMSLMAYAVRSDDISLLKYLLKLCADQIAFPKLDPDVDTFAYSVNTSVFADAISLGRTAALAELIKASGAGLPLDDLVQKSGLTIPEKPRYYQGLSINGKKRKDWAKAGNPHAHDIRTSGVKQIPLLTAAHAGSIESVQWFLSDAPARHYMEFGDTNKSDKRVEVLGLSDLGFEGTVTNWLRTRNLLALHCAIISVAKKDTREQLALIKYLLSAMPDSLDHKSAEGWTPLHCAVNVYRPDIVKVLLEAGTNQRSRDSCGRNVLHNMLVKVRCAPRNTDIGLPRTDPSKFKEIISHFDKTHVEEMLLEKCTVTSVHSGMTPLAYFMASIPSQVGTKITEYRKTDMLEALARYSDGTDLKIVNGAGDLPLHSAVRKSLCAISSYLISCNPSLLHYENTVGITPLELAVDLYLHDRVSNPPDLDAQSLRMSQNAWSGEHLPDASFCDKTTIEEETERLMECSKKRTYEICIQAAEEAGPKKRRLVSLAEANEVTKRPMSSRTREIRRVRSADIEAMYKEQLIDEVSQWMIET